MKKVKKMNDKFKKHDDKHVNIITHNDDWYAKYDVLSNNNPLGAQEGLGRVVRGGSWNYNYNACRVANRNDFYPGSWYYIYGFRCVRYD